MAAYVVRSIFEEVVRPPRGDHAVLAERFNARFYGKGMLKAKEETDLKGSDGAYRG